MVDVNFGTGLSVRLREGIRLNGGPLNRGFTVHQKIKEDVPLVETA